MNQPVDVAVLKSPAFGEPGTTPLPYRLDHLESCGMRLAWDDRRARLSGWRRRLVDRIERATTPFVQTWQMRRRIATSPVTVAMFESEGHGLALARVVGWQRRTMLVIVSCWLADLVQRSGRVRLALYRALYRRVDLVTVFSANQVPVLRDVLGIDESRIEVIPFGVDTSEVRSHVASSAGYALAAGRDAARDWETLYAAARGSDARVVVIARPRHLPAHAPDEVDVRGYLDRADYLDALAACDTVVLVTRVAAYPSGQTVLLEALALGKRCIVTDTPAMRSFAGDLPVEWVPVGDVDALRRALAAVADTPAPDVPPDRLDASSMWLAFAAAVNARRASGGGDV